MWSKWAALFALFSCLNVYYQVTNLSLCACNDQLFKDSHFKYRSGWSPKAGKWEGGAEGREDLQVELSIPPSYPPLLEQGLCIETVPVCPLHWAKLSFSRLRWGVFLPISARIMRLTSNQMSGTLPFLFALSASMFNSPCPACLSRFLTHSHLGVQRELGFLFKSLWFCTVSMNKSMKLRKECW